MRRFFILALVLLLVFSLTANAFAVSVDSDCFYYNSSDGNTHLGVIAASEFDSEIFGYYQDWLKSDRRLLLSNSSGTIFWFYTLDSTADVILTYPWIDSEGENKGLGLNCHGADKDEGVGVCFSVAVGSDGRLHYDGELLGGSDGVQLCGRFTRLNCYIVMCSPSLLNKISFPSPTSDYVVDFQGNLAIDDDINVSGGSGGSSGDDSEQSGILGFLSDFWEKLKSFFLGLFVPSEGYFKAWYNEVKAAFEKKLSPIFALYEQLTSFFDSVAAAEDTTLFNNPILVSCLSWVKGLITGLVLLLTMIAAYKKIISFIAI